MRIGRALLFLLVIIIGIVIFINKCKNDPAKTAAAGGKQGTGQPLTVSGIVASGAPLSEKIYSTGSILANEEVGLRNEVPGRIVKIYFQEGNRVNKGDLLVKLNDDELLAQVKKAESDFDISKKSEERQKDLLGINAISQQEYEIAHSTFSKMQADIELLRAQIRKTEIRAPFSGTIGLKYVSEGAYLPSNTLIASLQEIDRVKIEFSIPERYGNLVEKNQEIGFTIESRSDTFHATIYATEPKIDLATRSVMMRAIAANSQHFLFPGSFAKVIVPLKQIPDAVMVPTQSLIPELKGQRLLIAKNNSVKSVSVKTGIRNDSTVQIISGINPGDTVITTGIMQLRPGAPVKVVVR